MIYGNARNTRKGFTLIETRDRTMPPSGIGSSNYPSNIFIGGDDLA